MCLPPDPPVIDFEVSPVWAKAYGERGYLVPEDLIRRPPDERIDEIALLRTEIRQLKDEMAMLYERMATKPQAPMANRARPEAQPAAKTPPAPQPSAPSQPRTLGPEWERYNRGE